MRLCLSRDTGLIPVLAAKTKAGSMRVFKKCPDCLVSVEMGQPHECNEMLKEMLKKHLNAPEVQTDEHSATNRGAVGSNPTGRTQDDNRVV